MNFPDNEDVDLTLRHVTRRFPQDLARLLLPSMPQIEVVGWTDTQVTARQRRLDRTLELRMLGQRRLLHVEWQLRMPADMGYRVFEYQALLAMALEDERAESRAPPREPRPEEKSETLRSPSDEPPEEGPSHQPARAAIASTVVLLSGRDEPWPEWGQYRLSAESEPFSGARYRVDAVYQRTVDELWARGPLGWIFIPLAKDVTEDVLRQVVARIKNEVPRRDFEELAAALIVLADIDRRRRFTRAILQKLFPEEVIVQNWIYQLGEERGLSKGVERGLAQGIEKGLAQGKNEMTLHLIERRLGRPLASQEQARVLDRVAAMGADRIGDLAIDLSREALEHWLTGSNGG